MIIISIKSTEVFSRVCNLPLLPTVNMPKRERDLVREKNNFSEERGVEKWEIIKYLLCARLTSQKQHVLLSLQ